MSNPAKSSRAKREAKQKLIREAERAQLQGTPIPQQSNADHEHDHHHHHHRDKSIPNFVAKTNLLESWLKNFRSEFTWMKRRRFPKSPPCRRCGRQYYYGAASKHTECPGSAGAGGIEMGLILHTMDVKALSTSTCDLRTHPRTALARSPSTRTTFPLLAPAMRVMPLQWD